MGRAEWWRAGVLTTLVGFTSSAAVVLTGLRSLGAGADEAASGLMVLLLTCGVGTVLLATRTRIPVVLAWSTPGAALLATSGQVDGGWPAAVGAFCLVGLLILLTGLWPRLGEWIAAIPTPVAQAMLAGVLVQLCLGLVRGLEADPWLVAPVVVAWLVVTVWSPRWAVPVAFAVAMVVVVGWLAVHDWPVAASSFVPVTFTLPTLTAGAVLGIALPLYVVTMASQNVPGVAVLASFGYTAPWRPSMLVTGVGTVLGAPLGGHAINLAAITAALSAGPEGGSDPAQRWRSARVAGFTYLALAVFSGVIAAAVIAAPVSVMAAVAGLALLGTLASSLAASLAEESFRLPAVVTFVVAASGVAPGGVGAAFWALLAGLGVLALTRPRRAAVRR